MRRVALLGLTDLDWIVSVFGLQRAGYAVLTLSPRLSLQVIANLMEKASCEAVIYRDSPQLTTVVNSLKDGNSMHTLSMMYRQDYDKPGCRQAPFVRDIDRDPERERIVLIQHSSGSAGLPTASMCDSQILTR